jgi:hypothetical protein
MKGRARFTDDRIMARAVGQNSRDALKKNLCGKSKRAATRRRV